MPDPRALSRFPITVQAPWEAVVTRLRQQIVLGWWRPGTELPAERRIAEDLRVTRDAVRQALRSLADEGLIKLGGARRVAARVTTDVLARSATRRETLDARRDELEESNRVRACLESACADLAATRVTSEDLGFLDQAQGSLRAAHRSKDAELFRAADNDFHLAVALAADRQELALAVLNERVKMLDMLVPFLSSGFGRFQDCYLEHEVILSALSDNSPVDAASAMRSHIDQTWKTIETELSELRQIQSTNSAAP